MTTAQAILRSYTAPRAILRQMIAAGAGESRALIWVMAACVLFFFARLPGLARDAHLNPDGPGLDALMGGAFMGAVLVAPLFLYGVAALTHLLALPLRGKATWLQARQSLFWASLCSTPLVLLQGLVEGFIGPGVQYSIMSLLAFAGFALIWLSNLIQFERTGA